MGRSCYFCGKRIGTKDEPIYGYVLQGVGNIKCCQECKDDYTSMEGSKPKVVDARGKSARPVPHDAGRMGSNKNRQQVVPKEKPKRRGLFG